MVWNKTKLYNSTHPKYLSVTLYKLVSYKQHIRNTKMKVATRHKLLLQNMEKIQVLFEQQL